MKNFLYGRMRSPLLVIEASILLFAVLWRYDSPLLSAIVSAGIQYAPFGTSPPQESVVGVLYLVPTIAVTFGLAYAVRRNPRRWLPALMVGAMGLSSLMVAGLVYWWLPFNLSLAAAGMLLASLVLAVWKLHSHILALPFQVWIGSGLAMLLLLILPLVTLVALCAFAAAWDLFAVFRGPLRVVAEVVKEESPIGKILLLRTGPSAIGLGDIVFYCLILGIGESVSVFAGMAAFMGILGGAVITFTILSVKKPKALPGLPIPILLAFIGIGLSMVV